MQHIQLGTSMPYRQQEESISSMQRSALVVTPLAGTASGSQRFGSASGAPPLIANVRSLISEKFDRPAWV